MSILDLIFPKTCLECKKEGKYLCDKCLVKAKILRPVCPYCEKASIDGFTHAKCRKKYGLDGLTSVWDYDGVIKKAIMALKYKYSTEVGKELSENYIKELLTRSDLVRGGVLVPIPIHWYRENVRGFNQSVEIGEEVATKLNRKFIPDLLIKKKSTTPQATLSVAERKQNLEGVFTVNPHYDLNSMHFVLLFDDVFTTGSTLKEAAKVLKRSGVKKVWGLTIAR
ncbi:MAG TPA: ComF family protein [Candidatus Saccharimonadales bacterium]|jgi:ComF family protein|nr:ComF family protein [Candidatus Saccharimonadales bacterium]